MLICFVLVLSCKSENNEDVATKEDKSKTVLNGNLVDQDPSFEVYDFDGLETYLNKKDDKTYVINFWATWCGPCIKELPYFEKLNKNYQSNRVEVILVSLDFPSKYETHLEPYIKKNKIASKVVALNDTDSNSWIPKVDENWSGAIPATIIYNKDKRKFYEQSFKYDELEREVEQFLK